MILDYPHDDTRDAFDHAVFDACAYGPVDLLTLDADELTSAQSAPRLLDTVTPAGDSLTGMAKLRRRTDAIDPAWLIELTRDWVAALVVEQDSSLGHTVTAAYLREDNHAVIEDVNPAGLHRFIAAKSPAAIDNLVMTLMPFTQDANVDGAPRRYTEEEWQQGCERDWGPVHIASVVVGVRRPDHPADPADAELIRSAISVLTANTATAVAVPADDGSGLTVAHVSRGRLRRHLLALVSRPHQPEGVLS